MADDWQDFVTTSTVLTKKPNWIEEPVSSFEDNRELISYPGTDMDIYNLNDLLSHTITYNYTNLTKDDEYYFVNFFLTQQGKLKRFWLPWWKNSFTLYESIKTNDTIINIEYCRYDKVDKGYERFFILLKNGDYISREIIAVVEHIGYESMIIHTAMDRNIEQNDIVFFGRLLLVRFDIDELEFDFLNNKVSELSIPFKELQINEYQEERSYQLISGES